tara:strand:- start:1302 stop:1841 length:540 start_codon:yes stop_codon:yes gene_type:complete
MKTFKEYRMETEASNTTYKLVDKKTGKVVFTGKYNQVVKKDKETGYKHKVVTEDAPANSAGGGNIAGIGVGPDGEPGVHVKKKKKENPLTKLISRFRVKEDYNKLEVENLINKIDGNEDVTDNQIKPIVSNLKRKKECGTYNENVGIKTFRYVVDNQINTIVSEEIRNRVAGALLKKYL